ncbi:MAG TPA: TraX family protein [Bacilli bacterium]|nr:TraX family protein [Bacilli bacterium]
MKKIQFTGSTLKIIAMVTMLLDHIGAGILDRVLISNGLEAVSFFNIGAITSFGNFQIIGYIALIFRILGRLAFPIYCYLLVEGFKYTKDIKKYILRLLLFAIISEIPFDLAFAGKLISFEQQNIFFSLALGMTLLWSYKSINKYKDNKILLKTLSFISMFAISGIILFLISFAKWGDKSIIELGFNYMVIIYLIALLFTFISYIILKKKTSLQSIQIRYSKLLSLIIFSVIAFIIKCDYSFGILVILTIIYIFRNKKIKSFIYGIIALAFFDHCEILGIFSVIPIGLYNGKKGLSMKYVFYIFYPLHLLIIYFICAYFKIL